MTDWFAGVNKSAQCCCCVSANIIVTPTFFNVQKQSGAVLLKPVYGLTLKRSHEMHVVAQRELAQIHAEKLCSQSPKSSL